MPSFTSNSNLRIADAPWQKIWLTAGALVVLLVGGWEGVWRWYGFTPSLNDDAGLWAVTRSNVEEGNTRAIVLVGASRIQLDVNLNVFAQVTGLKPLQLAMNGEVPIVMLRHFAQDESFCGVLICGMTEDWLYVDIEGGRPAEWIKAYETQTWSASVEQRLRMLVQSHAVFRLPDLAPLTVWRRLRAGQWPTPSYTTLLPDRSILADYTKLDIVAHRKRREETTREAYRLPVWSPAEFRERAHKLGEIIAPIRKRGGLVIFVRFPTSGALWEMEAKRYPRKDYWNVLAEETGAMTIHFKDYPELAHFRCPDGSHLDYREAIPFTHAFATILTETLQHR